MKSSSPSENPSSSDPSPEIRPAVKARLRKRRKMVGYFVLLLHIAGIFSSVDAIMETRTPQGAVAWVVSLNSLPAVALPAYWVLGRSDFNGYVHARQSEDREFRATVEALRTEYPEYFSDAGQYPAVGAAERLVKLPTLRGNQVDLLIDGEATFESILTGIHSAKEYVLVEFFIVKDDNIGKTLQQAMISKAKEGVKVYFLYDEVGSHALPDRYLQQLRDAGVEARNFHTRKGPSNRFQVNFRNHRKIVITDGTQAWIGGHNVGDEYITGGEEFSSWRDTHIKIRGPAVLPIQLTFLEDWNWAADETLTLNWGVSEAAGEQEVLIVPTGPADTKETAALLFTHAVNSATQRIWIASPYFIPDQGLTHAIQLAILRGVDVRFLIPDEADHLLPYLAAYTFFEDLGPGATILRYTPGFMHQKVMLVDDKVSAVGTANFDNRSFRLNFEITALILDEKFNTQVATMLEEDFSNSVPMAYNELATRNYFFRLAARAAALTAPTL